MEDKVFKWDNKDIDTNNPFENLFHEWLKIQVRLYKQFHEDIGKRFPILLEKSDNGGNEYNWNIRDEHTN